MTVRIAIVSSKANQSRVRLRCSHLGKHARNVTVGAVVIGPMLIALILIACDSTLERASAPSNNQIVEAGKDAAANSDESDLDALVTGNTAFALDLYRTLAPTDGNIFFSPYSISIALAMTYSGARGETELQMAKTLGFRLSQQRLHPAFNLLNVTLAGRGENIDEDRVTRFQLNVANALWGQDGFNYLDEFHDNLVEHYGAGMRLVDFISAPVQSRLLINNWVAEQTEDRIQNLMSKGVINSLTRLVLTNAIYFHGSWSNPFDVHATTAGVFNLVDGGQVDVPMMYQNARLLYANGPTYQAVELSYVGYEISMLVVMPAEGTLRSFEDSWGPDALQRILRRSHEAELDLKLPRFEIESAFQLAETLEQMGMPNAFTHPAEADGADLSGFDGKRDLFVGAVLHKAFVAVDEAGTEAAAATAVSFELQSLAEEATMVVDRPFLFLILDRKTTTVLFMGRVMDPR